MTTALRVEVHGEDGAAARLTELGAGAFDVRTRRVPGEPAALVVATAPGEDVDVVLRPGDDAAAALWRDRLRPWAAVVHGAWFESGVAVLHEHDPAWPLLARRRLRRLGEVLGAGDGAGVQLDHIGSTAVPGLAAKAVVDLQVRVAALPSREEVTALLAPLGYVLAPGSRPGSPGVGRDARMPGDPEGLDDVAYAKRLLVAPDPVVPSILHVRLASSPFAGHVVAFRDWMRATPQGRQRYEDVKRRLEAEHAGDADYDDYTRGKGELLRELAPVWTAWVRDAARR